MNERGGPEASDTEVGKRRLPAGLLAPCVVLAGSGWDFLLRVTGRALFICLIDQLKKNVCRCPENSAEPTIAILHPCWDVHGRAVPRMTKGIERYA
jgi:hypothetical protein